MSMFIYFEYAFFQWLQRQVLYIFPVFVPYWNTINIYMYAYSYYMGAGGGVKQQDIITWIKTSLFKQCYVITRMYQISADIHIIDSRR